MSPEAATAPAATRPAIRPERAEEDWLNTLRGFAACAVVWFHLNETVSFHEQPYRWLTKHGWLGVEVFFVVSGCLIVATARRSSTWIKFLIRRVCRIYPPYLASLVVVIGAAAFRRVTIGVNDVAVIPHSLSAWLATLSLSTSPVTSVPTINWVYWSLSYEMAFYLVVALAFVRTRWAPAILIGVTALGLLHRLGVIPVAPFFLDLWDLFALGAALAWADRPRVAVPLGVLAAAALLVHGSMPVIAVSLMTFVSIILSRVGSTAAYFHEPVFRRVGTVSYSLYLLHVPVGVAIFAHGLRPEQVDGRPIVHIGCDLVILAVCIGCSAIFWKFVEQPAHEFGRRLTSGPTAPRTRSP